MPVQGVNQSDSIRNDQLRIAQRRTEEARAEEQKKASPNDREVAEARRTTEAGQGETVDITA